MDSQPKLHYQLIVGEILFSHKDGEGLVQATRVNGILADEQRSLPVRLLNKCQQILQANFVNLMGEDIKDIKVINVVFYGVNYLGEFTYDEFHGVPEGQQIQEKADTSATSGPTLVKPAKTLEEAIAEAQK